jgi:hypothetical protein
MKEKALEQKAEVDDIVQFEKDKEDGKTNIAPNWKPGQYERIFGGDNEN